MPESGICDLSLVYHPLRRWGKLEMGSFSRQRAANRFQTVFQQRLDAASDPNEA